MTTIHGKKAIITGANRSIGQAIATSFAKEGAEVCFSYRSDEEGAKKTPGKGFYADFSSLEGVKTFFDLAIEYLGAVDILVNNAAGYDTSDFLNLDPKTFNHLLQVGLAAPMYLTQLAAKNMIERGVGGSIINISSIAGMNPYKEHVAHCTTKAGLNMLTKNTALELGKYQIRVNAIAPGSTPYEKDGSVVNEIPLQRYGVPKDHANLALFLASEDSSWITGAIIPVDGGEFL